MNPDVPEILSLGAIESPKDPRDLQLGSIQAPVAVPTEYLPDLSAVPVYYQGGTPACGGHAGARFKSALDFAEMRVAVARSPRQVDAINKRDDGVPNEEGTFLRQIFATLKNVGACQLALHPNDISLPIAEYRNPRAINPAALADAALNKVGAYAFVSDRSFEGLKQAIFRNKAVILLIYCDSGFFRTTKPTFNERRYGHFVVAEAFDDNGIYITDSTESDPALARKYMHKSYLGFVREAATAVNIPNWLLVGLTSRSAIIRKLIELYTQLLPFYPKVANPSPSQ